MVTTDLLRGCSHLADLPEHILQELARIGSEISVTVNDTLFVDMEPADAFYLVVSGEVRLCHELGMGDLRTSDMVTDGELFAWSALVEPYRYTSTAIAACPTRLVSFDAAALRRLCTEDKDVGSEILSKVVQLLSNRLDSARGRLTND
jgi:CRP-like cAMP-binding protein